jgi:hypothetical protein
MCGSDRSLQPWISCQLPFENGTQIQIRMDVCDSWAFSLYSGSKET